MSSATKFDVYAMAFGVMACVVIIFIDLTMQLNALRGAVSDPVCVECHDPLTIPEEAR